MSAHHCSLFGSDSGHASATGRSISLGSLVDVPLAWAASLEAIEDAGDFISHRGERQLILAAGPLVPAARAIASLREEIHEGATDALPADEPRVWRDWDRVIALTLTGDEPELLHSMRHLPPHAARTAMCLESTTTVAAVVDDVIALPALAGRSHVAFESSAILVARAGLGGDVASLPTKATRILESDLPSAMPGVDHVIFVGSGWAGPLAVRCTHAFATIRGIRAEAHSLRDAHYGAIDHADARSIVWFLGKSSVDARDRAAATGAVVVVSQRDPLLDYIEVQRMARELAGPSGSEES